MTTNNPTLELGTVEFRDGTLTARIFRRCINPQKGKTRKRVAVYLDLELIEEYEKLHPRLENGSFGGVLSDDLNKSLVVWMQVHGLIKESC